MKVEVLDTTLRDGAQHRQVSYSSVDKLDVIAALDRLGVHYTEYGAPGFDPAAEKLSRLTLPVTRSVPVASRGGETFTPYVARYPFRTRSFRNDL